MVAGGEGDDRVARYFTDCHAAVLALAARDAAFSDMCQELREVDRALERLAERRDGAAADRLTECQGWIERLRTEMQEALANAKIVPLRPARRLHDP